MEALRAFWDKTSESYDEWFHSERGERIFRLEAEALLRMLEDLKPGLLLDVGCGTGLFTKFLEGRGWKTLGVDYSAGMALKAKGKGVNILLADACRLPFQDEIFNLVLLFTVLEFVGCEGEALREARRVLKPDGRLLVAVHNLANPWNLYRKARGMLKASSAYRFARLYTAGRLVKVLAEAGFRVEKSCSAVFHPYLLRFEERGLALKFGGSLLFFRAARL
ncbi:MAG: class I SAM-dependent methyltransferase [Candidatus Hecatellaceae archaeon]